MSATLTAIPQGGLDFRSDWRISFLFGLASAGLVEETRPILFPHPVQQLQRRRTLLLAWAHRPKVNPKPHGRLWKAPTCLRWPTSGYTPWTLQGQQSIVWE